MTFFYGTNSEVLLGVNYYADSKLYALEIACECIVEGKKRYAAVAKSDGKQAGIVLLDNEKNAKSVGCVKSGESLTSNDSAR